MWGLWVTAETISKNKGSLGDSSAENRGSLEPYIRVTSIMGVAFPQNMPPLMFFLETLNGVVILINPVLSNSIQRSQIIKNTKHKLQTIMLCYSVCIVTNLKVELGCMLYSCKCMHSFGKIK